MTFDPTKPLDNSDIDSAELRTQLIGLRDDYIVLPKNYHDYAAGNYKIPEAYTKSSGAITTSWAWYTCNAIYLDRGGVIRYVASIGYYSNFYEGSYMQIFKNGVAVSGTNHALSGVSGGPLSYTHDVSIVAGDYLQTKIYARGTVYGGSYTDLGLLLKSLGNSILQFPYTV